MGHTDGGVGDEAAGDQELDALVRISAEGLALGGERKSRLLGAADLYPINPSRSTSQAYPGGSPMGTTVTRTSQRGGMEVLRKCREWGWG